MPSVPRLRRSLRAWYGREARDLPWRRTRDPYAVWISEVMLQQTTVAAVLPYYDRFLRAYPDIASLARSDPDELLALWSGLGYYRRARYLRQAALTMVERHHGRFPSSLEEIRALPGIGPYTAGAIASICFGTRAAAVDGNVTRVISRLYALPDRSPARVWQIAEELIPGDAPGDWTQALMELGARTCRPLAPACDQCPVTAECLAHAGGAPTRYPAARRRPNQTRARADVVIFVRNSSVRNKSRVLLVRRDPAELLGGLWELPGTGSALGFSSTPKPRASRRLGTVKQAITSRLLTLDVWLAPPSSATRLDSSFRAPRSTSHLWADPRRLDRIPIAAASRKALALLPA